MITDAEHEAHRKEAEKSLRGLSKLLGGDDKALAHIKSKTSNDDDAVTIATNFYKHGHAVLDLRLVRK